jgi:hypothetical protein
MTCGMLRLVSHTKSDGFGRSRRDGLVLTLTYGNENYELLLGVQIRDISDVTTVYDELLNTPELLHHWAWLCVFHRLQPIQPRIVGPVTRL